jgi:hypothetical protein
MRMMGAGKARGLTQDRKDRSVHIVTSISNSVFSTTKPRQLAPISYPC